MGLEGTADHADGRHEYAAITPGVPMSGASLLGLAPLSGRGEFGVTGAERQLQEAALRQSRNPAGRLAIALHLSRLVAPAPRPHHMRIARACLQDTATRHDGQVFSLANGDLVLLCRNGAKPDTLAGRHAAADPHALPDVLDRLFRVDTPQGVTLVSVWPLETRSDDLLAYATACLAQAPSPSFVAPGVAGQASTMDAIGTVISTAEITDLLQRQTGVLLSSGAKRGETGQLRPIYREVTFSIAALEARIAPQGKVNDDPFLFRHLASRLDQRMLDMLIEQLASKTPLDIATQSAPETGALLHVNLTVAGIQSSSFTRLAELCRRQTLPGGVPHAARLGVEVNLIEAVADPRGFARARLAVAEAGFTLLLDGVSHLALSLSRPAAFQPDLIKLDWSPRIAELAPHEASIIDQTIADFGPHRMILQRAETEAALRWGMSRGIRRFQGRHVDAMLGASRIMACRQAEACTLRQCIERSGATGTAGRAGCTNLRLLDEAAPPLHAPSAPPRFPRSEAARGAGRAEEILS